MRLKMSSAKWCPFYLGLNVLIKYHIEYSNAMTKVQQRLDFAFTTGTPYVTFTGDLLDV